MAVCAAILDMNIMAVDIPQFGQAALKLVTLPRERCNCVQVADNRHRALLRASGKRPGDGHSAERSDQPAAPHSIASSAWASRSGGTVRPSVLAVLRLITNSNLVGCSTGRSAGFAPLRILSTYQTPVRPLLKFSGR